MISLQKNLIAKIKKLQKYGNYFLESKTLDALEFDAQMLRVFWLGT